MQLGAAAVYIIKQNAVPSLLFATIFYLISAHDCLTTPVNWSRFCLHVFALAGL